MFYVYSTATCSGSYTLYHDNSNKDLAVVKKSVTINGGHGVANKHLFTPRGVVTEVSDEDMEFLLANPKFAKHVKDGFLTYEKKFVAPEKMAASMAEKDGSAPLTPADFEESDNSAGDTKVYKKKGKK